jgi:hypothetical protein
MPNNLDALNTERDADAAIWARTLGLGETQFKNLPVGARFVFNKDDADRPFCILVKTARGYRHEVGGRHWKTGARTACFRLPPKDGV